MLISFHGEALLFLGVDLNQRCFKASDGQVAQFGVDGMQEYEFRDGRRVGQIQFDQVRYRQ